MSRFSHMTFSLSTNWFASRTTPGEAMAGAARDLGFDALELGYRLTEAQGEDIARCVEAGKITVPSVHAYCPEPVSVPSGHPELYLLAAIDPDESAMAAIFLKRTVEFAKRTGSRAIVLHAGRVRKCWVYSDELMERAERLAELDVDPAGDFSYSWRAKVNMMRRKQLAGKHLDALRRQLDVILPLCEKAGVALCMENLPSWEAIPNELEAALFITSYNTPFLRYWHDIGHAVARERMRWTPDATKIALQMLPFTAGVHIHDVKDFTSDHHAPGKGQVDFKKLAVYGTADVIRVLEPSSAVSQNDLRDGLAFIKQCWPPQPISKA